MRGGGGCSCSVARPATSTPRLSARRPPSEAPAVPAQREPRAHLTSQPRPWCPPHPRRESGPAHAHAPPRLRPRAPGACRGIAEALQNLVGSTAAPTLGMLLRLQNLSRLIWVGNLSANRICRAYFTQIVCIGGVWGREVEGRLRGGSIALTEPKPTTAWNARTDVHHPARSPGREGKRRERPVISHCHYLLQPTHPRSCLLRL